MTLFEQGIEWARKGRSKRVPQFVDRLANHEFEQFMLGAESVWDA